MRLSRVVLASALPFAIAALSGCPDNGGGGVADAGTGINLNDGGFNFGEGEGVAGEGEGAGVDAGPINTTVVVDSVTPPTGPIQGGNRVVLEGIGFAGVDQDTGQSLNHVFFDGIEGSGVLGIQLPNKISVFVPPCASPGPGHLQAGCPG